MVANFMTGSENRKAESCLLVEQSSAMEGEVHGLLDLHWEDLAGVAFEVAFE